ncbi:hypothetical protein ACX0G7_10615 [Flavitalea antarctica]
MVDLAKPLGIHEGLIFYGDHELNDLVYYFPDEVSLAQQSGASTGNGNKNFYELFFQIFNEGDVMDGGLDELRKTAGSILSIGVQCSVSPSRLEKALQKIKATRRFPENLRASAPLWRDGTVNLMVLDAINNQANTLGNDAFVKSIVGANKPSLMSSDLKSVFNVRFDRKGTALIQSALDGDTGNVAGVLYDLKFNAIRPALNLRIWANLGRCYDSIAHQLSIKAEVTYYVKFSLGAELNWITRKLEEEGHMKVEVLSQAEDAETKKMMDEMINDFKESILREMFRPYVNPETPAVPLAAGAEAAAGSVVPVVGVAYKFTHEKISHDKVIDVDYRERSTVIRTHNPQSHLWVMGKQIAANRDKYIQRVIFSEVWREQSLSINMVYDYDQPNADLLGAEVIIWRSKHGIASNVKEGRFAMPAGVDPIKNITFHKQNKDKKEIAWLYDRNEPVGYYYQIRFTYSGSVPNVSSPAEIITPPIFSTNEDLVIFPDTYIFYKHIEVRQGNIDFAIFKSVDVTLRLKEAIGDRADVSAGVKDASGNSVDVKPKVKDAFGNSVNVKPGVTNPNGNSADTRPGAKDASGNSADTRPGVKDASSNSADTRPGFKDASGNSVNITAGSTNAPDGSINVAPKFRDEFSNVLGVETITINATNNRETWIVRGKDKSHLYIEATKEFHYIDGRASLKTEPQYLQEDELIINKPFQRAQFSLIPVIGGKSDSVSEILLEIIVTSPVLDEPVTTMHRIAGPAFTIDEIKIPLNTDKDKITYRASAIMKDAAIKEINSGDITSNALLINLKRLTQNEVVFVWQGRSPEALGLKNLVVELHRKGTPVTNLENIEYKGDKLPEPIIKIFDVDVQIEWRINKRFQNGSRERTEFKALDGQKITISGE